MKYTIFYFDNKVTRMFEEKADEQGNKFMALTSPQNFVSRDEIVAKIVDVESADDLKDHVDEGYDFHIFQKSSGLKTGEGISFDKDNSVYRALDYGFVKYDSDKLAKNILNQILKSGE